MDTAKNSPGREGPAYVLDAIGVYQICRDPGFFRTAPAFLFLSDTARDVIDRVTRELLQPRCPHCSGVRELVTPLAEAFGRIVVKLAREHPAALEPLVEIIARRLGYRPRPIVLYHKVDGKIASLEI